jgi:ferredoxin
MRFPIWPRPSTRAFIREARRLPGYSFFDWLHGYVYARWPYLYIGIGTGEHPLAKRAKPVIAWLDRRISGRVKPTLPAPLPAREGGDKLPSLARGGVGGEVGAGVGFADTYHGKVVTLAAATQLVTVKQDLNLGDLEHIVPYATARDIVLQNPDHIVAMACPCRAARANPCLPLDVCLIVGEPFAGFIREHQPERTRWINSAEAVEILTAEHMRGHVHHAFFKDAMLGRFYAICNCCSCCCGALQAQRNGVPMLAASGYVSVQDPELCIGCGVCVEFCQFAAIAMADGRAFIDAAACMGCGVCVDQCDLGALTLVLDERKGIPLEINDLMRAALGASLEA